MKKLVVCAMVVVMLGCAMFAIARPYKMSGVVVDDKGSIVEVELTNGYRYEVEVEPFYFNEGDEIIASVEEWGATSPKDDRVVGLKKA